MKVPDMGKNPKVTKAAPKSMINQKPILKLNKQSPMLGRDLGKK